MHTDWAARGAAGRSEAGCLRCCLASLNVKRPTRSGWVPAWAKLIHNAQIVRGQEGKEAAHAAPKHESRMGPAIVDRLGKPDHGQTDDSARDQGGQQPAVRGSSRGATP